MALNIPMPQTSGQALMSGMNAGGQLFSRIMQPIIQREQLAEQGKYHQGTLAQQQAQMQQQQQQFLQNLALRKQQEGRMAQMQQLQMQALRNKLDPNYEINQLKHMMDAFGGNQQQTQPESFIPSITGEQQNQIPEQMPLETPKSNGLNMESIKSNPILRGWFKKHFGVDPATTGKGDVLHGPARDAEDLEKLRIKEGEDSQVYQNAKSAYDAQTEQKKDLRDLRARTKAGLKAGEKEFFDQETGIPLGKEIPLSAKERESEEGNILFNELYPYVYKGAAPFSGEGSITRLENAAANYKTNPQARKMFDDLMLSDKMMAATTVNEASTLKAGHTNQTYNRLRDSLTAQDVPELIKKLIKQYQIPASAQLKASMRYQKALSDARIKARKSTPATQRLYYNPDMQAQHEATQNEKSVQKQFNPDQKVKVDMGNGKIEVMTYKEAKEKGYT